MAPIRKDHPSNLTGQQRVQGRREGRRNPPIQCWMTRGLAWQQGQALAENESQGKNSIDEKTSPELSQTWQKDREQQALGPERQQGILHLRTGPFEPFEPEAD